MEDPSVNSPTQLPAIPAVQQASGVAPGVPSQTLSLATGAEQGVGVVQQAVTVLMDTTQSPYQMSTKYAALKESYLAKTYGVTIE